MLLRSSENIAEEILSEIAQRALSGGDRELIRLQIDHEFRAFGWRRIRKIGLLVIPIILLAVIILPQMIRILREYERGMIFRLGKLLGTKGPGLIFLIPIVDRMVRMDLRVVTVDVARQEVMTRDNVPMSVDAVVYFRVVDPAAAVVRVENYLKAT